MSASVAWISVAPVKGMALEQRSDVQLDTFGVLGNRRFHVIGEDGRLLIFKSDGSVLVHADAGGYKPLNCPA